jgi:multiple sugar transport system permease protein
MSRAVTGRHSPDKPSHLRRAGEIWDGPTPWLILAVLWLAAFSIFPFLFAVYRSFFTFNIQSGKFVPAGLENWVMLFEDPRVWNALAVTLKYVSLGLGIELVLGFGIALLYNQDPIGVGFFRTAMVLPMVVPPAVVALMFQLMEHDSFGVISYYAYKLGLLTPQEPFLGGEGKHAMAAILLPDVWQWTPFMALIILAGLRSLPRHPFEAAMVDGANAWQRFRYLTLPMLMPVLVIAVLFRVIDLFNKSFDYVYILTAGGPGRRTEVLSYYDWLATFQYTNWGYGSVLGLFMLVIMVVFGNVLIRVFQLRW